MRYLESYCIRRWLWGHYENQLKVRLFWHQWEIDRVHEEQLELMELQRKRLVSEMRHEERERTVDCLRHLYIL